MTSPTFHDQSRGLEIKGVTVSIFTSGSPLTTGIQEDGQKNWASMKYFLKIRVILLLWGY